VIHSKPVACAEFATRIWLLDPAASADGTPDPVAATIFPFAVTRDFGIAAFAVDWAAAASETPLFAVVCALTAASYATLTLAGVAAVVIEVDDVESVS
jgi:hypothetical protein